MPTTTTTSTTTPMPTIGTALTDNADFQCLSQFMSVPFVPAVSTVFYKGQFCMINASGLMVPVPINDGATDNSTLRVVGQCDQQPRTGTASTEASSPSPLSVRTVGVFECNALVSDSFVQADAGLLVYATSDNQITKVSTKNPKAGIFLGFSPVTGRPLIWMGLAIPA